MFNITEADIGRYVRRISTGEIGTVIRDPGNWWIHPTVYYEWKNQRDDLEYVTVFPVVNLETNSWKGSYVTINYLDKTPSGKTTIWWVWVDYEAEHGYVLGDIKWYPQWRKYAFFPNTDTLYEPVCMREIAAFIDELMRLRKLEQAKKPAKAPTEG